MEEKKGDNIQTMMMEICGMAFYTVDVHQSVHQIINEMSYRYIKK